MMDWLRTSETWTVVLVVAWAWLGINVAIVLWRAVVYILRHRRFPDQAYYLDPKTGRWEPMD